MSAGSGPGPAPRPARCRPADRTFPEGVGRRHPVGEGEVGRRRHPPVRRRATAPQSGVVCVAEEGWTRRDPLGHGCYRLPDGQEQHPGDRRAFGVVPGGESHTSVISQNPGQLRHGRARMVGEVGRGGSWPPRRGGRRPAATAGTRVALSRNSSSGWSRHARSTQPGERSTPSTDRAPSRRPRSHHSQARCRGRGLGGATPDAGGIE